MCHYLLVHTLPTLAASPSQSQLASSRLLLESLKVQFQTLKHRGPVICQLCTLPVQAAFSPQTQTDMLPTLRQTQICRSFPHKSHLSPETNMVTGLGNVSSSSLS